MASTLVTASFSTRVGVAATWGTAPNVNNANPTPFSFDQTYGNGTSNTTLDRWYCAAVSLSDGGNSTIDLRALTDVDGTTVTIAEVVLLVIDNTSGTVGLYVGDSGANQFNGGGLKDDTSAMTIPAGGWAIIHCGAAGVATTANNKDVKLLNAGGATSSPKVWAFGRSA